MNAEDDGSCVIPQQEMRLCFCPCGSQLMLSLLSLTLLSPFPLTVASYPRSPTAAPPTVESPELESALLRLQNALDVWRETGARPRDPQMASWELGEEDGDNRAWEEENLLRAQRGELMVWPLSPFPGDHSLESLHYHEGGEEEGGKRNKALTSMAGDLQAFSREKGGFGFRFGKRWTVGDGGMEVRGSRKRTSGSHEGGF